MPKFPPFEKPYPTSFGARVTYADSVISAGREPDRAFDFCFECYDGDKVVAALLERAKSNPKLATGLTKYVSVDIRTSAPEHVQTDLFNP